MSESSTAKEIPAKSEADVAARRMQNQKKGVISRIWKSVFRSRREDDYEKRLQHLSKEEAAVHARIKRRAITARNIARNIFVLFGILEVAAVAFAIMAINALDMNWIGKTVRCLPAILWPALIFFIYTTVVRFMKMLDRKDQKTLERLRDERKAKLDELKERTNYYTTQQLIQRYDLDPAAKAAAASVLASKLGFDSGIKVFLEDESAKSSDVELAQSSTGLRNRRQTQSLSRNNSTESGGTPRSMNELQNELGVNRDNHMVVEHHQGSSPRDGGWIGRLAALLVGEDPSHCFALICGNCLRHNGLARKEDFPHTTYYCPHCHALNTASSSNQTVELESGLSTPRDSVEYTLLRSLSNASSCTASEAHDLHAGSIE